MPRKAASPLAGLEIAASGSFASYRISKHSEIQAMATELGAGWSSAIQSVTTHLLATQAEFDKGSNKLSVAKSMGIFIVDFSWLQECYNLRRRVPESKHILAGPPSTANLAVQAAAAAKNATPNGLSSGSKRPASPPSAAAGSPKQPAKKQKSSKDDTAAAGSNSPHDRPKIKQIAPEESKAQLAKSKDAQVPVDDRFFRPGFRVYIDDDGLIWDASLNQTNAGHNNNKFYRLQILHNASRTEYLTWSRWGRVGEIGQSASLGDSSLDQALAQFKKKFKDKSGLTWENRINSPKPGKYVFIERSYNDSDDEEEDDEAKGDDQVAKKEPPKCTLEPPVERLMELIFNQDLFAAAMADLNYDAKKLPLGKLSHATIMRGFSALKDLALLLDDNTLAQKNYGLPLAAATENLSNLYYSLIPHNFGRNRPPVVSSQDLIKMEVTLLESLTDMKTATQILKPEVKNEDVHPADRKYQGLNMKEMTPLDPEGAEFRQLHNYLVNTRGSTHSVNYRVDQIFRIERLGEKDRFDASRYGGAPQNRRLLWHGSGVTNYGGILSQGLRIAPPEAPSTGYMFDKGIYMADMSSKSANYCRTSRNGTALLLLCEAELGNPIQELTSADSSAGSAAKAKGMIATHGQGRVAPPVWKDASSVHPSLAGIQMPDTDGHAPTNTYIPNAGLYYNEYIAYDVAQVRLRYLFQVKL